MNRVALAAVGLLCLAGALGPAAAQDGPSLDEQIDLALGALDDAPPPDGTPPGAPKIVLGDFTGYARSSQPFDQQPFRKTSAAARRPRAADASRRDTAPKHG